MNVRRREKRGSHRFSLHALEVASEEHIARLFPPFKNPVRAL